MTEPASPASSLADQDPLEPLRKASGHRPFVIAQLGQSLDGRIATPTGESRWINRGAALDHLHRLRAAVDAVVVGVGTVIADDPMLTVRRVPGRDPARVIIDPNGRVPPHARCLADDGTRRLVIRRNGAASPSGVEALEVTSSQAIFSPLEIVAALHARGLKRLLVEGGAWTISSFLESGAIDRLHVLVAPVILGSGKPGLSLAPIARIEQALRPLTRVHVLPDGDVLFDCDLRNGKGG